MAVRRCERISNCRPPRACRGSTLWKGLKSIGVVTSWCLRDGKETIEVRYYISSLAVGVKRFAHAVRSHWGIENSCHWSLDMTYREDESRIRDRHLRENFAWLNRVHPVALEATSRPREPRHETPQLRLERRLPAGSPYWSNTFSVRWPCLTTEAIPDTRLPQAKARQARGARPS